MSPDAGAPFAGLRTFLASGSQAELRGASRGHLLPAQHQACGVDGAGGVRGQGAGWRGPAILTSAPFLPSHLRTQGLPGKRPPRAPLPSVWQEAPGCPGPLSSGGSTVGRAGAPGSRCLCGESRPPVLLLVSSECCTHQGPGGGWPDTALLAQPPRGWAGGHLLPGSCCGFK